MEKILITGVAGFIGYHLAKKLTGLGKSVVGIDNLNKKELDEVIDLFSENWSSLYHQNTDLSDLICDDFDELRWE